MTQLILVRHGQSFANLQEVFAGQSDPDLTNQGSMQAKALCDWLIENYKIDCIYSSDLIRAYNTAKPVAEKLNLEIHTTEKLREIYSGEWQGLKYSEIKELYPQEYDVWLKDIGNVKCPNGETFKDLAKRVTDEIYRIGEEKSGQTVLITTHATPIRALQAIVEKGDTSFAKDIPWTPNTSVTVAEYEKGKLTFKLIGYNDYLLDLKSKFPSGVV